MKNLRLLSATFLISTSTLFSCSSDDRDNRPHVTYTVSASSDIFSTIDFKGFNGDQAVVSPDLAVPGWSQPIRVNLPFTAVLNTSLSNTSAVPVEYSLAIIVNDSLVGQKTGILEAGATLAETLSTDANP